MKWKTKSFKTEKQQKKSKNFQSNPLFAQFTRAYIFSTLIGLLAGNLNNN